MDRFLSVLQFTSTLGISLTHTLYKNICKVKSKQWCGHFSIQSSHVTQHRALESGRENLHGSWVGPWDGRLRPHSAATQQLTAESVTGVRKDICKCKSQWKVHELGAGHSFWLTDYALGDAAFLLDSRMSGGEGGGRVGSSQQPPKQLFRMFGGLCVGISSFIPTLICSNDSVLF